MSLLDASFDQFHNFHQIIKKRHASGTNWCGHLYYLTIWQDFAKAFLEIKIRVSPKSPSSLTVLRGAKSSLFFSKIGQLWAQFFWNVWFYNISYKILQKTFHGINLADPLINLSFTFNFCALFLPFIQTKSWK